MGVGTRSHKSAGGHDKQGGRNKKEEKRILISAEEGRKSSEIWTHQKAIGNKRAKESAVHNKGGTSFGGGEKWSI